MADVGELRDAPKLFKQDGRIAWTGSAHQVHNLVRGMHPFPGAWTELPDGTVLRIHRTRVSDSDFGGEPGTVHHGKNALSVQCGKGMVDLLQVQAQGKPAMDVSAFLNGLRTPLRTFQT
jgi:methionyl-tRNA formyltransferase